MNNEKQTIRNLLSQVSVIIKKYEKIAELTGENFNIFRILKVEASEVTTHSAFLCELLNPKGSHGCKDIFLKLFLEQQREKQSEQKILDRFRDFDTFSSVSISESHIDFINADGTEGGRIDILIKNESNHAIIIENKIYAGDSPKQLIRYNKAFKNAPIFYLTLKGGAPSKDSKGELIEGDNYVCISYKDDILYWLEQCRKEAVTHSILRETISQYIYLIKYLTGQTMNENMKNEIETLITDNPEGFEVAKLIGKTFDNVQYQIHESSFEEVYRQWKEKFDDKFELKLFSFEGYDFFIRPSNEKNQGKRKLHYAIFPERHDKHDQLRQADDKEVQPIREYLNKLKKIEIILRNVNYTAWILSKYSPERLEFKDRVGLIISEERNAWAEKVINEAIDLIKLIFSDLMNHGGLQVKFNDELLSYLDIKK